MDRPETPEEAKNERRIVAILLLVILVLIGAGIGTLVDGPDPDPEEPPLAVATPVEPTPTPTPSPGQPGTTAPRIRTPTPTAPPTSTPQLGTGGGGRGGGRGRDGGGGGGSDSGVTLEIRGSSVLVDVADVAPGDDGTGRLTLLNAGEQRATLSVTDVHVSTTATEDTAGDGKLDEQFLVALRTESPDGRVDYLYGTGEGGRSLAALGAIEEPAASHRLAPGETADVVLDWHVPELTGNEIQGDVVEFDVTFELRTEES